MCNIDNIKPKMQGFEFNVAPTEEEEEEEEIAFKQG